MLNRRMVQPQLPGHLPHAHTTLYGPDNCLVTLPVVMPPHASPGDAATSPLLRRPCPVMPRPAAAPYPCRNRQRQLVHLPHRQRSPELDVTRLSIHPDLLMPDVHISRLRLRVGPETHHVEQAVVAVAYPDVPQVDDRQRQVTGIRLAWIGGLAVVLRRLSQDQIRWEQARIGIVEQGKEQLHRALRMPQPKKAVRPAYLPATAEGGPVPVAARFRVPVVQVAVIDLAGHQNDQGRVEQAELDRLAAVDVQRRVAETPGNDAEFRGVQDRFKRRAALQVALPERFLVGQEDEVSAPVVQVGQRPPRLFGMRRRGRFCTGKVREVLLASGGSVEWHPLLPPLSLKGYQRHRPCCSPQATDGPRHLPTLHQGGAEGKMPTRPL